MERITRHPLYQSADVLKRAFLVNGFHLYNDGESPEVVSSDQTVELYALPEEAVFKKIMLEGGKYALRTSLLPLELTGMKGKFPIKEIVCGKVYDGKDKKIPGHLYLEGVYADQGIVMKDIEEFWSRIAREVYGVAVYAKMESANKDIFRVMVCKEDDSKAVLGYTGCGNWLSKALLGTEDEKIKTWFFAIDIDAVALDLYQIESREKLYENLLKNLRTYEDKTPASGDTFANKAGNILRKMGYIEYVGNRIYEADAYVKMNMFQESWDSNNKGLNLVEPLGENGELTGLPTVLVPGMEQTMADNYHEGEETVKIFDIGHIFLPGKNGGKPVEKMAVAIGAYGPEIDAKSFKAEMDKFLTELGISNHFFMPTDIPIAYDQKNCWLVLDERPAYLEGNLGGISPKAEANYGIGTHGYMAQFELEPLERKAASEYYFIPPELA